MIFANFNSEKIRKDFEVLKKPIVYLDSACMSLKPKQVVDKINEYYNEYPACAGRSAHKLSERLNEEILKARENVKKFIGAERIEEIVFTRNTTEGINLIANSYDLNFGDEVIISDKEHNSNLIPWLKLQKERGIKVVICYGNTDGTFNLDNFKNCFSEKTKLVSVVMASNIDGVTNPVEEIVDIAHEKGVEVLVDAAQSVPHKEIDVRKLDVDFLVFSGHKMCGPTGTGVLYGKKKLFEKLKQFIVGGETVIDSTYDSYVMEKIPARFEAGLQDYAGIVGLGEACRYLEKIGLRNIQEHEVKLNEIITEALKDNEKIELLGPESAELRGGIFSFNVKGLPPLDVARMLNSSRGIMVRAGAHCVHSWFNAKNMQGSVRVSLYLYNNEEDVRVFVEEIDKITRMVR